MQIQDKIKKMESVRGRNHDLVLFRQWLDEYLPEHKRLHKIQVAGTNGKGSTCKWLSMFLNNAGFTTGMFTSPHLMSHMERIQIDQKDIPHTEWERIYDTWSAFFEEKSMTMFEMDLWMALVYFIENRVNVAIIEVGMGGRLDATTALDYNATLITNIGLDHTEYLGDTKEQIAFEKSGIFKPSSIALTTEEDPACQKVMELVADYIDAMLGFVSLPGVQKVKEGYRFEYNAHTYTVSLPRYQLDNMVLALETLYVLGYPIEHAHILKALNDFSWEGRFMLIKRDPMIIVDGAHNVLGIQALVSSLSGFKGQIYFSGLKEKDVKNMLVELEKLSCPITLVEFDCDRLYDLSSLEYPVISLDQLETIIKTTQEDSLICGSLYFVGDVLKRIRD